jgi:hypothetical protein
VRVPDAWRSAPVLDALVSVLSFLSEDTYEFEFVPLQDDEPLDGFIEYATTPYSGRIDEVVMFSGGLDSLAGAVTETVVGGRQVLLVNHRSNEKLTPRHQELVRGLERHASSCPPLHFPVRLNKAKELGREHTQRTRSFLFAALGTLFARMADLSRLRFYENGVVSLNLPLSPQVVGARASRTTHPCVLAGFGRLFSALFGCRFDVENPFLWDTKTDVVRRIGDSGCGHLVALSTSCGHTWERTARHTHCGVCSQCIDRRFAVLAAGQEANDPIDAYGLDLLTGPRRPGEPKTLLAAYLELANRVERMGEADFRAQFGELFRAIPYLKLPTAVGATRVFTLYQSHARQVAGVVDRALADHATAIRRQELPRNCLLRLVVDQPEPGGSDENSDRPSGNYFLGRGRFWRIRYGTGRENIYPKDRGFDFLRVLFAHPNVTFTASELAARVASGTAGDVRTVSVGEAAEAGVGVSGRPGADAALDRDAVDALRARLAEIRALKPTLVDDVSVAGVENRDELDAEERRIVAQLGQDLGHTGRSRKLGDLKEKVRKRVSIAIRRAIDLIGDDDAPLAAHLRKPVLITGSNLCYAPPSGVCWVLEE